MTSSLSKSGPLKVKSKWSPPTWTTIKVVCSNPLIQTIAAVSYSARRQGCNNKQGQDSYINKHCGLSSARKTTLRNEKIEVKIAEVEACRFDSLCCHGYNNKDVNNIKCKDTGIKPWFPWSIHPSLTCYADFITLYTTSTKCNSAAESTCGLVFFYSRTLNRFYLDSSDSWVLSPQLCLEKSLTPSWENRFILKNFGSFSAGCSLILSWDRPSMQNKSCPAFIRWLFFFITLQQMLRHTHSLTLQHPWGATSPPLNFSHFFLPHFYSTASSPSHPNSADFKVAAI